MSSAESETPNRTSSLKIIKYPHPTLRYRSKPVTRINQRLRSVVAEMFELMYDAKGVGLAANQVGLPLRLFVMNLAAKGGEGDELVYINPEISRPKGNDELEEGCLSLPGLYAPVRRSERIFVSSLNLKGELKEEELSGMHARVVQHETDHLDGVLFIDRLGVAAAAAIRDDLLGFEYQFQQAREAGAIRNEAQIVEHRRAWEQDFCQP